MSKPGWGLKTIKPRTLVAITSILLLALAYGCAGDDILTLEQRAYILDTQILCPVCDGQTIDQSNAQTAVDLRQLVRERLEAGDSNMEVLDFVAARYGDGVIGSPGTGNFWGILAWSAPVIVFVIGALILGVVLFSIRRGSGKIAHPHVAAQSADNQIKLPPQEFLDRVRHDLNKIRAAGEKDD